MSNHIFLHKKFPKQFKSEFFSSKIVKLVVLGIFVDWLKNDQSAVGTSQNVKNKKKLNRFFCDRILLKF